MFYVATIGRLSMKCVLRNHIFSKGQGDGPVTVPMLVELNLALLFYISGGVGHYSIARRCMFHVAVVPPYHIIRCCSPTLPPDRLFTPLPIKDSSTDHVSCFEDP